MFRSVVAAVALQFDRAAEAAVASKLFSAGVAAMVLQLFRLAVAPVASQFFSSDGEAGALQICWFKLRCNVTTLL